MARTSDIERFLAAWMQMRQVVQAANFNRFQREGLSATQFMALNVLPTAGLGMTLTELARRLNLSAATLNKTVETLEARGLLRRERQAKDARKLQITVTKAGAALQNAASSEFHGFMAGLFAALTRAEKAGLINGLEAVVRASGTNAAASGKSRAPRSPASDRPTRRGAAGPRAKRSARPVQPR